MYHLQGLRCAAEPVANNNSEKCWSIRETAVEEEEEEHYYNITRVPGNCESCNCRGALPQPKINPQRPLNAIGTCTPREREIKAIADKATD